MLPTLKHLGRGNPYRHMDEAQRDLRRKLRAQARQLGDAESLKRTHTSRSQLDRILDLGNERIQLDTVFKAAHVLSREGARFNGTNPLRVSRSVRAGFYFKKVPIIMTIVAIDITTVAAVVTRM
jgi:hypothetical protein